MTDSDSVGARLPLTIWMNMPAFNQEDLFRALVATGQVDLRVIYARDLPHERRVLGWSHDRAGYPHRFLPRHLGIIAAARIALTQRGRIQIVNGVWAEPAFLAALIVLGVRRQPFAIYAEASEPGAGRRGTLRLKRLIGSWVATRASGLLAVSHFAARFFTGLGFAPEHLYPFGYFRAAPPDYRRPTPHNGDPIDIVFVGQFIRRKGLDLLLAAVGPVFERHPHLRLSLIGAGPERSELERQIDSHGLRGRVVFEDALPAGCLRERVARADLLVLPSRWDGWGMVVNEALSVGTPVIVSDRCGAADIVRHGHNGFVFNGGDTADLRACLEHFLALPESWTEMRRAALQSGRHLSTDVAAPYLLDCLRHMLGSTQTIPVPPWAVQSRLARTAP